jgi:L-iditol 2-dehydrogenase
MRRKEIAFFNVRRSNHESEEALELLAAHPQMFAPLVTHARPLAESGMPSINWNTTAMAWARS